MINLPNHCRVSWCDQGSREHTRHEVTLDTWRGLAYTGQRRPMDVQLVVHGLDDDDAQPMVVIVDKLNQVDVVLDWIQAHELATTLLTEARAFRRMQHPA